MKKQFRKHKFNAVITERDGIKFASKKEALHYDCLQLLKASGELLFFLRQAPFHLPGSVRYVVDFIEFYANGDTLFVDVKGRDTPQSKQKRRQVEALYPIKILLV